MTNAELELSFYEKFLLGRGIEPYPVQEQAISLIFAGKSLLVTVPTGTGKTLLAKAARRSSVRSHQARAGGMRYIVIGSCLAPCRRSRLNSNIAPYKLYKGLRK